MQKVNEKIKAYLKLNACSGNFDGLEIEGGSNENNLDITNCTFLKNNQISRNAKLRNSTIEDSVVQNGATITDSIVKRSFVGSETSIINYSIVSDTIISKTTLPKSKSAYISVINNSQITNDVILGGCDFNQTKSRGGSVFAFAHIGGGEFKKSLIIGTPPSDDSAKTLIEVGHFGYYGDLLILGIRSADKTGKPFVLDSDEYFSSIKTILECAFLERTLPDNLTAQRGRTNIGGGTVISNYDPIHETKAGAIILLSLIGANVTLSPYLTVLPNSLIANGSSNIAREENVILENSLVIGSNSEGVVLDNYYDENQKKIMNDRSNEEIGFLLRYFSFLLSLVEVCSSTSKNADKLESFAWMSAKRSIAKIANDVGKKSIPKYLDLLKTSVQTIERIKMSNQGDFGRFEHRLLIQSEVLDKTSEIQSVANSKVDAINQLIDDNEEIDIFSLSKSNKNDYKYDNDIKIVLTEKQKSISP